MRKFYSIFGFGCLVQQIYSPSDSYFMALVVWYNKYIPYHTCMLWLWLSGTTNIFPITLLFYGFGCLVQQIYSLSHSYFMGLVVWYNKYIPYHTSILWFWLSGTTNIFPITLVCYGFGCLVQQIYSLSHSYFMVLVVWFNKYILYHTPILWLWLSGTTTIILPITLLFNGFGCLVQQIYSI